MSTPIVTPPVLPFDRLNAEWSPVACIKREAAAYYADLFRLRFPDLAALASDMEAQGVRVEIEPRRIRRGDILGLLRDIEVERIEQRHVEVVPE